MNNVESNSSQLLLSAHDIVKSYKHGTNELQILKSVSLEIKPAEMLCIMGGSGAGKSTLLHILGTLERPNSGSLRFLGQSLSIKNEDELAKFRNESMGFVFQFHHLLPEFTAQENVMMPALIAGWSRQKAALRADELLNDMGLSNRKTHYPNELSGGEQQRVAIARALTRQPKILFADEPTGNLDSKNEQMVRDLLLNLNEKYKLAVLAVTHNSEFAKSFPKIKHLKDGQWIS